MSTIIQLTQGSKEWLEYRLKMRNASESAAVLGLSPWMTPYQLWLLKTGRASTKTTAAMQHGTDLEPAARAAYEDKTGNIMQPLVMQDGAYSASLDGMDLDGQLIVEIKCPYKGKASTLFEDAILGLYPVYYGVQIQHQLMVSGAQTAHLWIYAEGDGLLLPVDRDQEVMDRIRQGWEQFQGYLDSDTPPPLAEADTVIREDDVWSAAAKAYSEAKVAADKADAVLAQAKAELVAMAQHPKESGAGVSVTRFWKQGAVAYAKVPALLGLDLSAYRGKSREEVRVSMT
ncbi:MAG: YqaJ viral recombinase family protein [Rhodoferax sp.]|nr:YqaJ viral recombinase family protein [Rhodoferax sp.]